MASGGWSGAKPVAGSETAQPATTTTYTLVCSNVGSQIATASVTVTGTTPPAVSGLSATAIVPDRINLSWNPPAGNTGKWVSGYYAGYFWDWTGGDPAVAVAAVDMSTMTHFIFARYATGGGTLGGTYGQLVPGAGTGHDPAIENALIDKAHAGGIKALMMVGGMGDGAGFVGSTASSDVRTAFINLILDQAAAKHYDGADIDWEEHLDTTQQQSQVIAFLSELRAAAVQYPYYAAPHQPFIITWPGFWGNINYPTVTPWHAQVAALVDQYNLMTYGMSGSWQGWVSWHHAPLAGAQPSHPTSIEASIQEYVALGVPKNKLGIGIGLYGIYYRPPVTGPRQSIDTMPD